MDGWIVTTIFTDDGDENRIKSIFNGTTSTYFVGNYYEVTGSAVTKYYYAGSQRIALRSNGTVNYLLGDHLGSTSLTTSSTGTVISELRYKAWGEVRYASGTTPTKYTYTGQFTYATDFGLMYYGARWYDSSLSRFAQADTVLPGAGNPQAWDRYAYVSNGPIRYNDPTGHIECEEDSNGVCNAYTQADQISDLKLIIKDRFNWNAQGKWRLKELNDIYRTGDDIQNYVDKLTIGGGADWMGKYMSGTTIAHAGNDTLPGLMGQGNRTTSWPWNEIYLDKGWSNKDLAHELAEIWDLKSSQFVTTGGYYGGVADQLNKAFGGDIMSHPFACRFCNDGNLGNVPLTNKWGSGYANTSTEDYFSESFSHMIYPNPVGDSKGMPAGVQGWLDWQITIQTSILEVPFGVQD